MNNDAVWLRQNWEQLPPALQEKAKALQRTEERFSCDAWYQLMQEGREEFNLPPVHPWSNFCILMMKSLYKGEQDTNAKTLSDLTDQIGGGNAT